MLKRKLDRWARPGQDIKALLEAARVGEPAATEAFVTRFWSRAHRIGFLITHDAAAAEDIAQEAIADGLRSLDRFDPSRPFLPWMDRIAARRAHDWVRRAQRQPQVVAVEDDAPDTEDQSVEEIAQRLGATAVGQALARLELEQREAIVLRHLLDYTPQEIAELIDVPSGTVRSRLHRGLERLRQGLENANERSADEQAG